MAHTTKIGLFLLVYLWSSQIFPAASPHATPNIAELNIHYAPENIALSSDCRWMAITTMCGIYLYDVTEGTHKILYESDFFPQLTIAFSPNNGYLVYGSPMGVSCYCLQTGNITKLPLEQPTALAFSPDGAMLLIAIENMLYVWDLGSHMLRIELMAADTKPSTCTLAINHENNRIAVGTASGHLMIIEINFIHETSFLIQDIKHQSAITNICFGKNNDFFYTTGSALWIKNPAPPEQEREIRVHNKHGGKNLPFISMAYNPESHQLFATTYDGKVWKIDHSAIKNYHFGPRSTHLRIFPSADGRYGVIIPPREYSDDEETCTIMICPLTEEDLSILSHKPSYALKQPALTLQETRLNIVSDDVLE